MRGKKTTIISTSRASDITDLADESLANGNESRDSNRSRHGNESNHGNEDSPNCSDPDKSQGERARCATGSRGREKAVFECKYSRGGEKTESERGPDTPGLMGNFVFGEPEDAWKRVAPTWGLPRR